MSEKVVKHYDVIITGRVQGVGFRYSALNQAEKLGIKGYVKNLFSGDVKLEIEGSEMATRLMLDWCRQGPTTARVENANISEGNLKSYNNFEVRY